MKILFYFLFLALSNLHASLFPDYDKNCDAILSHRADPYYVQERGNHVPKLIHQIWFGDQADRPKQTLTWQQYQTRPFLYAYYLWTEYDLDFFKTFMLPKNYDLVKTFLKKKQWWAASDVLRYELLRCFGGIYVDCEFHSPSIDDALADLHKIFPQTGLTFVTEPNARNIGSDNALFVMNGILVSPAHHQFYEYLCDKISTNVDFWHTRKKNYDSMYCTGPFFLNKCLNGVATVLPRSFIIELGMCKLE